jgi:hypothetical protein
MLPITLRMVQGRGGKAIANQLLASANPSAGFTELFLEGVDNLKLNVESRKGIHEYVLGDLTDTKLLGSL